MEITQKEVNTAQVLGACTKVKVRVSLLLTLYLYGYILL